MIHSSSKAIGFITLGCAKNEVDTAHMIARLAESGFDVFDLDKEQVAVSVDDLDAVVVNTCSFLQTAIEESLETIFDVASFPSIIKGDTKLIVAGCMPSRFGDDLTDALSEASLFLPCADESNIVPVIDELLGVERDPSIICPDGVPLRKSTSASAYVKISDGCDRFCSFCAIPLIRGRYHSFPYDQIATEVKGLIAQGVKEIVLIAQDTGIWGSDLSPKQSLSSLLERLATDFSATWFRVLYIQPEHVDDRLLHTIATYDNICDYLDIPFQHIDEKLLSSMNRKGSREAFLDLIDRIRTMIPDVALRTTFIVGYPGESDAQFEELCDFVSETDLDYVGIFAFSPEEGTRAASLPNQIDEETKQDRLRTLREIADAVSATRLARFIGKTIPVLVLGEEEDGQLFGRSEFQAPDVDGVTYIDEGCIGQIVPVTIEDSLYYEMEGTREQ